MSDDHPKSGSTIIDRIAAMSPSEAAAELQAPDVVHDLCTRTDPTRYADLAERTAVELRDADTDGAGRLALLAATVRFNALFLRTHPDRLVDVVDHRCRW